ncbi:MAG: tRNA-dihydrouridine synthase [Bacteroidales bacterium]|jgi:tRNA-dihydrouridine synthase|nr:tRNA-dihydrouridine synthase [Bacteroidales bacterium]NLM92193.1 tRNA-dihydrouridine synthase [Bacteroidales bacterium]
MQIGKPHNFWMTHGHPLFALAPMEDVTDTAFRELVLRLSDRGQLHVLYTEFTSTDGLCHPIGRERVNHRLKVSESERQLLREKNVKIVAQVWGNKPEKYFQAIRYIEDNFDFDGIDINMGCPVRNVVAHGSCSALINQEPLTGEIIAAAREATKLPLSVKTRLGVKQVDTERWMQFLLRQPLQAIILHGRIQKQMSQGQANWDEIGKAVEMRDELAPHIRIIGNGDVDTIADGLSLSLNYGTDGVMIGRGIFKNPWLFSPERGEVKPEERIKTLMIHLDVFEKNWGTEKHFAILRRFFKIYLNGFPGAAELRQQMMQVNHYAEARMVILNFKQAMQEGQNGGLEGF